MCQMMMNTRDTNKAEKENRMLTISSQSLNTVLKVKSRMDGNIQVFDLVTPWLPESCSPLLLPSERAWFHIQ